MSNSELYWSFNHRQELEEILARFGINKNDICLVGSLALSLKNIRSNGDVDFCAKPDVISLISENMTGNYISENVNLVTKKYEIVGVSDEKLIDDPNYHELVNGFKVIRVEIEFSVKNCRLWKKDYQDIPLIEQYALTSNNWDWSLVRDSTSILVSMMQMVSPNEDNVQKTYAHKMLQYVKKILIYGRKIAKKIINFSLKPQSLIKKIYSKYQNIEDNTHLLNLLETEVVLKYPTAKLIGKNYQNDYFNRMDIIVRYLAIEEYFYKNDIGFSLYTKMQKYRGCTGNYKESFIDLIESISRKGFDIYSQIPVDLKFSLLNGSHRLALALYFNIPEVPIRILKRAEAEQVKPYCIQWFRDNSFSEEEISIIESKKIEVFQRCGFFFYVILWPPVQSFFDEIQNQLLQTYRIVSCLDFEFEEVDFQTFTRRIYEIDDIPRWKVERKIYAMLTYPKKVRLLSLEIPNPKFRKKMINNHDISDVGAKLKAKFRTMYAAKVDNYVYDIIIHTADNYDHNIQIAKIITDFNDMRRNSFLQTLSN